MLGLTGAKYVYHKDNRDYRTTFDLAGTRYETINLPRYSALRPPVTFVLSKMSCYDGTQTKKRGHRDIISRWPRRARSGLLCAPHSLAAQEGG